MNAQTRERGGRTMVWSWFLAGSPELSSTVLSGTEEPVHGLPAGIHFDEKLGERVTPVSRGVLIFHRPLPLVVPAKRRLREFRPPHVNTRHRGTSRPAAILGTSTGISISSEISSKAESPEYIGKMYENWSREFVGLRFVQFSFFGEFIDVAGNTGKRRNWKTWRERGERVRSSKLEDGSVRWKRQWWMETQGNGNVRNTEEKE